MKREGDRNLKVSPSVKPASCQRVPSHRLAKTANSKFSSLFLNLCILYDLFSPIIVGQIFGLYVALIRYLHYDGGILVKTHRNGIEVGVVTSKRNRIRSTPLSGSASQVATTSGLSDSQNPPLIKALLTAMLNRECFWLKCCMSYFLGLDEIRFFLQ